MNYVRATLIAVSLGLVMTSPLYAGHTHKDNYCEYERSDKIEKRLDRQFNRIERGIESDRLTYKEARELKKRYRRIRRLSREFLEDGYLSHREYRKLTRKLNKNSRLIKDYMHNGVDRYVAYHDDYSDSRRNSYRWD